MLSLKEIFFRKLLWIFLILFIAIGISLYFWLKEIYISSAQKELLGNIDIITVNIQKVNNLDKYAKNIKKHSGIRLTIIDQNGAVIAESDKDKLSMDNHISRQEILDAKNHQYGYATRDSKTVNRKLIYVAKLLKIGKNRYYIRLARTMDEVASSLLATSAKIALVFGLFVIFAYRMILGIGKEIQNQTQDILKYLDDMGSKNRHTEIESHYSIEFNKITQLLTRTSQKLSKKRKQKNKYTARLKLANRQKDDIISAISHELKNPVTVINGYAQTLAEDREIPPAISRKFLSTIQQNTKKLTQIIDRLRLAVKLDENKQTIHIVKTDISHITSSSIETLKINYPNRTITLETKANPTIMADSTLMEIAITNIIENALKYSTDEINITIKSNSIEVTDSGIGIAQKEIEKITDKFYRISHNSWNNSLGIGLSVVLNIVKIHNFKLEIQSKPEQGSNFIIHFKK